MFAVLPVIRFTGVDAMGVRVGRWFEMGTEQLDDDWVGPCHASGRNATADHPHESWDLDVGDVQSWLRAQRVCLEHCPFLVACQARRTRLYPHPARNPQAVIWAGVVYSDTGRILDTAGLRRLSATQRGRELRAEQSWIATGS